MVDFGRINSWKLLAAAAIAYATCVALLNYLQLQMHKAAVYNGFKGTQADLLVFDLRMGYTPDQARHIITSWGPLGCKLYVVTEVLDYIWLMPGYGTALIVLMNRLGAWAARKTGLNVLRRSYAWVLAGLAVDAVENALQLALVFPYLHQPLLLSSQRWTWLAVAASAVNQTKWWIIRCTAALLLLLVAAVLSPSTAKPRRQQAVKGQ